MKFANHSKLFVVTFALFVVNVILIFLPVIKLEAVNTLTNKVADTETVAVQEIFMNSEKGRIMWGDAVGTGRTIFLIGLAIAVIALACLVITFLTKKISTKLLILPKVWSIYSFIIFGGITMIYFFYLKDKASSSSVIQIFPTILGYLYLVTIIAFLILVFKLSSKIKKERLQNAS